MRFTSPTKWHPVGKQSCLLLTGRIRTTSHKHSLRQTGYLLLVGTHSSQYWIRVCWSSIQICFSLAATTVKLSCLIREAASAPSRRAVPHHAAPSQGPCLSRSPESPPRKKPSQLRGHLTSNFTGTLTPKRMTRRVLNPGKCQPFVWSVGFSRSSSPKDFFKKSPPYSAKRRASLGRLICESASCRPRR